MLKMAKEVGCKTMNGTGMMLFQGLAAIELIMGEKVDSEYMKQKLGITYD
jgi:shikimate dehydrogenase